MEISEYIESMGFFLIPLIILLLLSIAITIIIIINALNSRSYKRKDYADGRDQVEIAQKTEYNIKAMLNDFTNNHERLIRVYNESMQTEISNINKMQKQKLEDTNEKISNLIISNETKLDKIGDILEKRISDLQLGNEKKIDEMKKIVDEKLDETLEKRFNSSFNLIQEQFKHVSEQVGEMKDVANSVGDLKKILSNVKTRGTFGEVQLGLLLEQILSPSQYSQNVQVVEGTGQRVDFAIKLPNKDDEITLLPIDAKFPLESYERFLKASEEIDKKSQDKARKEISSTVKKMAKEISEKYINPPQTTNFAIMYIAIEGLYGEVLQDNELLDEIQRDFRVIISGPTTFSAILNSLQMGFKTLKIQKYSSEIWNALMSFKKEFNLFTALLTKTQKKVTEVSDTIERATKRTTKIEKELNKVSEISSGEVDAINKSILIDSSDDEE